jgi:NADPH:quinone reductase-like Zn-dependent oxidoreductase
VDLLQAVEDQVEPELEGAHVVVRALDVRGAQGREDLKVLADLLEQGTIVPAIDRRFDLADAAEAVRYQGEGHPRGKVVVTVTS